MGVRGFAAHQKSTPHSKDPRYLPTVDFRYKKMRTILLDKLYHLRAPRNATLLKKTKMHPETRRRSAALEVPQSKEVYDQRVDGTSGPLQTTFDSLGTTSENRSTPAVDPQVRAGEEGTTNLSDDRDNLTNALLAFLDAQIQGQPKRLADSGTQIPPPDETRDHAANQLTRGSITRLTPKAGAIATGRVTSNLPLEGLSKRLGLTSQPNTTEVPETKGEVALQAQTATDAADHDSQNVNTESVTSGGVDKTQATDPNPITAPQASGSSYTVPHHMAQNDAGSPHQQHSRVRRAREYLRMKEMITAKREIAAGTLVEGTGPTTRIAAREAENPRPVKRAKTSTDNTSNHLWNAEAPQEHSAPEQHEGVDAVEKSKAYERVIARMICGDIEAIVRLKEVVKELQDQSQNEKFVDIYDDMAISRNLALRNLASYPATMSRIAKMGRRPPNLDFANYQHNGRSIDR
ncbi:MAG: hypothetical protein Q9221_005484 [Calogaya cf. arnoldii]